MEELLCPTRLIVWQRWGQKGCPEHPKEGGSYKASTLILLWQVKYHPASCVILQSPCREALARLNSQGSQCMHEEDGQGS